MRTACCGSIALLRNCVGTRSPTLYCVGYRAGEEMAAVQTWSYNNQMSKGLQDLLGQPDGVQQTSCPHPLLKPPVPTPSSVCAAANPLLTPHTPVCHHHELIVSPQMHHLTEQHTQHPPAPTGHQLNQAHTLLVVLLGIPAAGKTTLASLLCGTAAQHNGVL